MDDYQHPKYPPNITMCFEEALIFFMVHQAASQFPFGNAAAGEEYKQTRY